MDLCDPDGSILDVYTPPPGPHLSVTGSLTWSFMIMLFGLYNTHCIQLQKMHSDLIKYFAVFPDYFKMQKTLLELPICQSDI